MKTVQELLNQLKSNEDILSKFQLGYLYDTGNLVSQDDSKAFEYYKQAADINTSEENKLNVKYKKLAMYNIGLMYFYGRGVTENKQQALEIITQIANDENAEANYVIGYIYAAGDGVEKDYQKAAEHYLLAANKNYAEAQFSLGKLYYDGLIKTTSEKNKKEMATKYFELAKKHGCAKAANYLNSLVSLWPSEDWDLLSSPNDCKLRSESLEKTLIPTGSFAPEAGKVYKNKCFSREQLKRLVKESEKSFFAKNKKEFSLEELLEKHKETFKDSVDPNLIAWLNMIIEQGLHYGHYVIGHYYLQEMHRHSFKLKKIFDALEEKAIDEDSEYSKQMQASDYKNIYIYYILQYVRTSHNLKRAFVGGIGSAQEDLNELKAYRKYLNRIDSYCYDFYDFCLMSELSDQTNPEDGKIYLEEEGTRCNNSKSFKYKYIFKDLDGNKKEGELTIDKETFTKQILDDEKPRIFQKISDRSDLTPKIYHYRALCKISPYELEPSTNKAFNKYSALAREDDALFEKIQAIVGAITLFNKNNHKMDVLPSVLPESLDPLLQFINSNNIEEYKRWSSLFLNQQQILNFHMLFCDRAIETNRIDILQELFFLESFDINCVIPKLKMTPLELMIEQGKTEVVKQLLKRKALDVNFNNPLLKAVSEEQTDIVILLLSHPNVDVNASNEISGANPLWLAAKHGFLEIVQELLDHPAISVNYQCGKLSNRELKFLEFINKKKMSVQEVAECYDRQDIVDLLQSHKKTASIKRAESRQSNMSNQATHSSLNSNHQNNSPQVHFMFRGAQSQQKGFNPSNPEERIINVEISHDNNIGTSTTQPKSKVSL